ncbi:MAG: restriction endonuclease subunit M, partial [Bacteroidetes bacterium]|nr:restriction endonuclease subunit M [Bacteroidota bacterium]
MQQARSREMAEVFTPSWICNAQNNLIDNTWFGRENVFNKVILAKDGSKIWQTNSEKITYPKGKTWKNYVLDTRLEISCGEAPYITSRYDSTTGESIQVKNRIGILDRKLRVINENVDSREDWLIESQTAFKNTYAFEWQGDSLLLAREAMLITFIENYTHKFEKEPLLKSIQNI